jgi:hypothetical protein
MTARRLHVVLKGLPPESRYKARLSGQRGGFRWSSTDFLLADLNDQIQALRLTVIATRPNRKRGSRVPKFVAYPRPTDRDKLDKDEQKNSLAYSYLIQLRPGGPVSRGHRIRGPLQAVAEPLRNTLPRASATTPKTPTGMPSRLPPVLSPEQRAEALMRLQGADRPRPKKVSPTGPPTWEDVPSTLIDRTKGEDGA